MSALSAVLVFAFIFVLVCKCETEEEFKNVERRGAYGSNGPDGYQNRDPIVPNDFGLDQHTHHHHSHYGSYQDGRPQDHYHHQHYHEVPGRPNGGQDQTIDMNSLNESGIPLDFAKSISEYSVSDLLLNVIEDGPHMRGEVQLSSRFGDGGDETERNAAQLPRFAKCAPELRTIKLAESNDPNVFYVPECTRIERCGGCCSHRLLSCQPVETETVTFSIIKTVYSGNRTLKYVEREPVLVERHTKCKCGCKIKAENCNSYQEYLESDCKCVCKNLDEERKCYRSSPDKFWNPDVCACQCRYVMPCSTGLQFDHNLCRCIQSQLKRRYILRDFAKERPEPPPAEDRN